MGTAATQARSAVRLDGERIVEIIEKPAAGATKSGLVAMPLYWLPRQFNRYLDRVPSLRNERHVSTALSAFLGDGGVVHAVPVRERVEVTTMEDVERAAERLPEMLRG